MSKRILFIIFAVVLLGAGIVYRAASAHEARAEADKIVAADLAGQDTSSAITTLKAFAAGHMGASVNFTLKGSYDRAQAAAAAAANTPAPNAQVYADAQRACSGKSDSIVQAKCNQAYVAAHLTAVATPTPVPAPKLAGYQYAVVAPLWTPDLAGALLLGAAAALALSAILRPRKRGR